MDTTYYVRPLLLVTQGPSVYAVNFVPTAVDIPSLRNVPKGSLILQVSDFDPLTCTSTDACAVFQKCSDGNLCTAPVVVALGGAGGGIPLADADQILSGNRIIATGANDLSITGTDLDSDSGHDVLTVDAQFGSTVQRIQSSAFRSLIDVAPPVDGVDIAFYVGQLQVDTVTGIIYFATAASADPDVSGAGSTWAAINVGGGGTSLADADQVLTGNRIIDAGVSNSLAITGLSINSDNGFDILSINDTTGILERNSIDSLRSLRGLSDPVNSVTTAWHVGQTYYNTGNQTIWTAIIKSTDPDNSPVGSLWQTVDGNLAVKDQTLTGTRLINTGFNNLAISGVSRVSNSDDNVATLDNATGVLGATHPDAFRVLSGAGAPIDGVEVAYYVGQLYVDTTNDAIYRAVTRSGLPDVSGGGSTWELVSTSTLLYDGTMAGNQLTVGNYMWRFNPANNDRLEMQAVTTAFTVNAHLNEFNNTLTEDSVDAVAVATGGWTDITGTNNTALATTNSGSRVEGLFAFDGVTDIFRLGAMVVGATRLILEIERLA